MKHVRSHLNSLLFYSVLYFLFLTVCYCVLTCHHRLPRACCYFDLFFYFLFFLLFIYFFNLSFCVALFVIVLSFFQKFSPVFLRLPALA